MTCYPLHTHTHKHTHAHIFYLFAVSPCPPDRQDLKSNSCAIVHRGRPRLLRWSAAGILLAAGTANFFGWVLRVHMMRNTRG